MRPVRLREVRDVPGLGEEQLGRVGDTDLVTLEDLGGAALHSEEVRSGTVTVTMLVTSLQLAHVQLLFP